MVDASYKVHGLKELERAFRDAPEKLGKAAAAAIKRAGITIVARQAREMAKRMNWKPPGGGKIAKLKEAMYVRHQATPRDLRIVFEVRAKGIPLKDYGAKQNPRGVKVTTIRGKPALLSAAFESKKYGGAILGRVSEDDPKHYGSPHVGRLPVKFLYGPNVLSQYIREEIQRVGADTWYERLPIELLRETNFALHRLGIS